MIVISPHLDDAVFSASAFLEGSTVVTICAGVPPHGTPPSDWDAASGFTSGREAMEARRAEDREAAKIGGFEVRHMDCLDAAYGFDKTVEVVTAAVCLKAPGTVIGPVGIRHIDHKRVAAALPPEAWRYEELPYAFVWPEENGREEPETVEPAHWKPEAVYAYRSQIRPSSHLAEILTSERIHR